MWQNAVTLFRLAKVQVDCWNCGGSRWFDVGLDICHGLDLLSVNEMTDDRLPGIDNVDGFNSSNWEVHVTTAEAEAVTSG